MYHTIAASRVRSSTGATTALLKLTEEKLFLIGVSASKLRFVMGIIISPCLYYF
jgi:hypothetical protein